MGDPQFPGLLTRIDDYSFQVCSRFDASFWFRMERIGDRDVITDYTLGSFPRESGGAILAECYRLLGLEPQAAIVFRDITPGHGPAMNAQAVVQARRLYSECARDLLIGLGARHVHETLEEDQGKFHLRLTGER